MRFLWIMPILGALLGTAVLVITVLGSSGAPQEAAGAAIAAACAILPYVFVRAIGEMARPNRGEQKEFWLGVIRSAWGNPNQAP